MRAPRGWRLSDSAAEGNVRVHWVDQEKIISPHFGSASRPTSTVKTKRNHPIADKLVRAMEKHVGGKTIDFKSALVGRDHAEELQKTVATRTDLAGFHPAHAVYVHAQNQVSVMSEQLTALKEMTQFTDLISKAEDEYLPSGPPMSPLPGVTEHVVFTTPYLLLAPGEGEWQAYFRRTLSGAPLPDRIARYEHHMKFGPTRNYWTKFVFEAYVNHRTDVIFLAGLPDVPESRPHSRVNQR